MNILGLDYGQKHIGVALATGPLAEPLATIPTDRFFAELPALTERHNITHIVVGDQTPPEFIKKLSIVHCPTGGIVLSIADETLSSSDARQSLLHTTQSKRRDKEHSAAAAIILQSYLDNK